MDNLKEGRQGIPAKWGADPKYRTGQSEVKEGWWQVKAGETPLKEEVNSNQEISHVFLWKWNKMKYITS